MTPRERLDRDGLVCVDDFVDADTCAAILRELRWAWWTPSTVVNKLDDGLVSHRSTSRTSESTGEFWFTDPLLDLVSGLEERVRETFGVAPETLEGWQATRYGPGGWFKGHFDAGHWAGTPAGERTATVLLYLESPEAGGETDFPCFDLSVEPRPGRVLVWHTLRPDGSVDRLMRHEARPVERGRKTTLVTWARERRVRNATERRSR